jgi:hypothetical protein
MVGVPDLALTNASTTILLLQNPQIAIVRQKADGGATLADKPQSPQQLVDIDGPADADALGREQAVIVRIPHRFVPVFPIPIDRHSHPGPLRNFIRVFL